MWNQASVSSSANSVTITEVPCSACKAPLFGYITKPTEEKEYRVNAKCPFCGDASFEVKLKGKVVFISTEYCHATPRPVYKPRESIAHPLEYTDEVNVQTEVRKQWRKK